ncbi:hypothetical protein R3Q06_35545 [Rhodococcus erythropolis]|uniref:hypothetical protein n=1 Tax=Rhodococcus erythropolis TaxID=1833 RepID=UPI002949E450|nr:hypothetical protein [Rhodococcus erythropolis]MDV6278688.1 hypothetical protein [Rhodococcus erythropolis]
MSRKENPKPDVADQIALFDLAAPAEATPEIAGADVAGAESTADVIADADATTASENEGAATTVDPVAATPSPEESEATKSETPAAALLPAASGDADGHAIIVTGTVKLLRLPDLR